MSKAAAISLAAELAGIADTLESAQLITDVLANGALPDDDTVKRAPKLLQAVLTLAVGRVRLLRKVVIGAADAALIAHRNNRALPHRKGDDPDVVLPRSLGKQKR